MIPEYWSEYSEQIPAGKRRGTVRNRIGQARGNPKTWDLLHLILAKRPRRLRIHKHCHLSMYTTTLANLLMGPYSRSFTHPIGHRTYPSPLRTASAILFAEYCFILNMNLSKDQQGGGGDDELIGSLVAG